MGLAGRAGEERGSGCDRRRTSISISLMLRTSTKFVRARACVRARVSVRACVRACVSVRVRARVARLAVVRWSRTRRGGIATGSTFTAFRKGPRARSRAAAPPHAARLACACFCSRDVALARCCSSPLMLRASAPPSRCSSAHSSRHFPRSRLVHFHTLVRLHRLTRLQSSVSGKFVMREEYWPSVRTGTCASELLATSSGYQSSGSSWAP